MLITRVVPNILPSFFSLLFVGNYCRFNKFFAAVDKFYLEVQVWIVWTLYFAILNIIHTATSVMHFLCQIFTYFCEWEPPDSNRRLCRVITNTFILKGLSLWLLLTRNTYFYHVINYTDISHIFFSTMKWKVYLSGLRSHCTSIMWPPYRLFYDISPPWPPIGYIMTIIILLGLTLCRASILFVSIV